MWKLIALLSAMVCIPLFLCFLSYSAPSKVTDVFEVTPWCQLYTLQVKGRMVHSTICEDGRSSETSYDVRHWRPGRGYTEEVVVETENK